MGSFSGEWIKWGRDPLKIWEGPSGVGITRNWTLENVAKLEVAVRAIAKI